MGHQPRPGLPPQSRARVRLIRLAASHPGWVLGFQDEVWWSRLARPALHAWAGAEAMRLRQLEAGKGDPDPKALACYGVLRDYSGEMMLRFVEGRPVSQVTEDFLAWTCVVLAEEGKAALLQVWEDASWHVSRRVRAWIKAQNLKAKKDGGVRIVSSWLPIKAPWLNRIEPKWVHGKRAIIEPDRKLTGDEVIERVCGYYGCERLDRLEQEVA